MIRPLVNIREDTVPPEIGSKSDVEAGEGARSRDRPIRAPAPAPTAAPSSVRRASIRAMLQSREGLLQALVLQEILGQPKWRE